MCLAQSDPQTLLKRSGTDLDAGEYAVAIQRATSAADLFRQSGDQNGLIRALTNAGLARMYSGAYDPALANFNEAADLSHRIRDLEYESTSFSNIGTVRYFKGQYTEAMEAYRKASWLVDSAPPAEWVNSRRQLAVANTAILYQTLGQYNRALDLYNTLLNGTHALDDREQAQVLANIGVLRRRLGDPRKALETYRMAQALYQKAGHRDGEISVLNNIGILEAMDLKDFKSAATTFTTALKLAEKSGDRPLIVHAHLYRGEAYYRGGLLAESQSDFEEAARGAASIGEKEEEWKADFGLARIAVAQNAAATDSLQRALKVIESMRADLSSSSLRSAFLADKRDVYDLLIETSSDPAAVFAYMEQSRARGLTDKVRAIASLDALKRALPSDTGLLEYWMDSHSAAVLSIAQGKAELRRVELSGADRDLIAHVPQLLSNASHSDWANTLRPLGEKLLNGVAASGIGKLIVVPDGALASIPFEALPFEGKLLIDRFTISYLPASGLLSKPASRRIRWFWQESLKALADPAPSSSGEAVMGTAWPRLTQAAREVEQISREIGGRAAIFEGASATKAAVLRSSGAEVLHFATHAFADLNNPDLSYILMASSNPAQRYDYLFLREVGELPLSNVRLATLSACDTGVGKDTPGEGVESFSRAFLGAGVPSVVTSLWSVGDQATAELMTRFYARLAAGDPVAEAMREAKLEFLHSKAASHPAYWAAFVVSGSGEMRVAYFVSWKWLLLPLLLIALAVWIRTRAGTA